MLNIHLAIDLGNTLVFSSLKRKLLITVSFIHYFIYSIHSKIYCLAQVGSTYQINVLKLLKQLQALFKVAFLFLYKPHKALGV